MSNRNFSKEVMNMKAYTVKYNCHGYKQISFLANNAKDAYIKAFYELIPEREGEMPYSAWVYSVTYQNGKQHFFNTCEGLAY